MNKKKKHGNKIGILAGAVLFALAACLYGAARWISGFADWYTTHVYARLVEVIGRVFGAVSLSVAEILLYALLLWAIALILVVIYDIVRYKGHGKVSTGMLSASIFLVGFLSFLYVANCGVNYYRTSFADTIGLETVEYTAEDLAGVCQWLTDEVNQASCNVVRDADGCMVFGEEMSGNSENSQENVSADITSAADVMEALAKRYPCLSGYYPQTKTLLFPKLLSYQSCTGVYSPFTIEANVNTDTTAYNIPFTKCHELSHLRGFMSEKEANFIAFLACINSSDADYSYSGYLIGWINCMNVLYRTDAETYAGIRSQLLPEVETDLKANSVYWEKYEGTVSEIHDKVNDSYLKANGQQEGIESYNRMVDLIVAYYETC